MLSFKLLSPVSVSLFVASAVSQTITCYSGGHQSDCTRFVNQFCNHATNNSFAPNDSMGRCFNDGNGGKCDLTVWLQNPSAANQTPSNANCKSALRAAMQSCPSGGTGQFTGAPFQFAIDPNVGQCSGDVPGNRIVSAAREATAARVASAARIATAAAAEPTAA